MITIRLPDVDRPLCAVEIATCKPGTLPPSPSNDSIWHQCRTTPDELNGWEMWARWIGNPSGYIQVERDLVVHVKDKCWFWNLRELAETEDFVCMVRGDL